MEEQPADQWWLDLTAAPQPDAPIEEAAAYYTSHGLHIIPLIGKNPAAWGNDWWTHPLTDPTEAFIALASDSRYTNLGWAQGYGTVAIDIDDPAKLPDTIRAVTKQGATNATRPGRGHRIYTTPDGLNPSNSTAGFPQQGWGEVRGHGGQIVIWGPHPDMAEQQYCYDPRQTIPEAPADLIEWLTPRGDYTTAATSQELANFHEQHQQTDHPAALKGIQTRLGKDLDAGRSIHDTFTSIACWTARETINGSYTADQARDALTVWWTQAWQQRGETQDGRLNPGRHELDGIWSWAIAQAVTQPDKPETPNQTGQAVDLPPNIPPAFWQARQTLTQIKQAAEAHIHAPDAVLGSVLPRIAAQDHTIKIGTYGDRTSGLTYYTALIGTPGTGKSSAMKAARKLIPARYNDIPEVGTGSGEGFTEQLFGYETIETEGKPEKQKIRTRWGLIATIDEGTKLAELAARGSGFTLLSVLRSAWTDEAIGDANATEERRRVVHPNTYAFGATVGLQPDRVEGLLADVDVGTPQRFLWLATTDPNAPATIPDWPTDWTWQPAKHPANDTVDNLNICRINLPTVAAREFVTTQQARNRGEVVADPLEVHRLLLQAKTAGLLALLDSQREITVEDWQLAGELCDASTAVRTWAADRLTERTRADRERRRDMTAADSAAHEDSQTSRAVESAVRSVVRRIHKLGTARRSDIMLAIAGKYRQLVTVDDIIGIAEDRNLIRTSGDGLWRTTKNDHGE